MPLKVFAGIGERFNTRTLGRKLFPNGDDMPRVFLNKPNHIRDREKLLYDRYGGFMTIAEIMKELGVSRNTAVRFAAHLPCLHPTGVRRYDIRDVAKAIESTRTPPEVS